MASGAPVKKGDILADKYRVEEILGAGAMGVVVAATHVELGKRVALKFMKVDAITGQEGIDRFLREARAAGRLRSEHTCQVHDVGRLANGAPYIVMELLDGEDLQAVIERSGRLPVGVAVRYIQQVCEAMDEAHRMGIVHRDLKPQNLFKVKKPNGAELIKVLDFGVSKVKAAGDLIETQTAAIIGTPVYMSPEQLSSSKQVDNRTDIWAIGVITYQLLVGKLPFDGKDFLQLCVAIGTGKVPAPRASRPDLDRALEAIILRCLERDRENRFATAGELGTALAPFANVMDAVPELHALHSEWQATDSELPATLHTLNPGSVAPTLPPTLAPLAHSTLGAAASQVNAKAAASRRRSRLIGPGAVVAVGTVIAAVALIATSGKANDPLPRIHTKVTSEPTLGSATAPTIEPIVTPAPAPRIAAVVPTPVTTIVAPKVSPFSCSGLKGLQHTPVDRARGNAALPVEVQLGDEIRADNVSLMFRPEGATDFIEIKMGKSGCNYTAKIPASAMHGRSISYYILAYDENKKVIAGTGAGGSPHIVGISGVAGSAVVTRHVDRPTAMLDAGRVEAAPVTVQPDPGAVMKETAREPAQPPTKKPCKANDPECGL